MVAVLTVFYMLLLLSCSLILITVYDKFIQALTFSDPPHYHK